MKMRINKEKLESIRGKFLKLGKEKFVFAYLWFKNEKPFKLRLVTKRGKVDDNQS